MSKKARLPFLSLPVDDYEAETAHLSLEEEGAYFRLLRLMWRTPGCSIPADAAWISRRMRVDEQTYDRIVTPILEEFFVKRRDKWVHERLSEWRKRAEHIRTTRSEAGSKGGKAKSLKEKENKSSKATVLLEANAKQKLGKIVPTITNPITNPISSETDDDDDGARVRPTAPTDLDTPRERVLVAMGLDPTGLTANGKIIGNHMDMMRLRKWQNDLGLSVDEIVRVVAEVCRKAPEPPGSFKYFDQPMARYAKERDEPIKKGTYNAKRTRRSAPGEAAKRGWLGDQ